MLKDPSIQIQLSLLLGMGKYQSAPHQYSEWGGWATKHMQVSYGGGGG